jgi:hypothetical protein
MKFRSLAVAGAIAALAAPASALAGTTSVTINGGTLDFGTAPSVGNFTAVTLDGSLVKTTNASVSNWSVNDATGSLLGWHVNVAASQFTTGGGTPSTLTTGSMTYAGPNMAAGASQSSLLNPVLLALRATPVPIDLSSDGSTAVPVVKSLAATGQGLWNFTQGASDLTLSVPATTKAGTYTSTVTFTLASGPV